MPTSLWAEISAAKELSQMTRTVLAVAARAGVRSLVKRKVPA